jgi:hypothetical protein
MLEYCHQESIAIKMEGRAGVFALLWLLDFTTDARLRDLFKKNAQGDRDEDLSKVFSRERGWPS